MSNILPFSKEYRINFYTKNISKPYINPIHEADDCLYINQDEIFSTSIKKLLSVKTDLLTKINHLPFWFESEYIDNIVSFFATLGEQYYEKGFYVLFGDSSKYADFETKINIFSKVRPIGIDTRTVLLKLQSERHFGILQKIPELDIPYEEKLPNLFWRGISTGCNFRHNMRDVAVKKFQSHPNKDIDIKFNSLVQGVSGEYIIGNWQDIRSQLKYKYLLSIEGNDVATNLKWILMSNSVCIMPVPQICSWFMEDHLQPYIHFVPVLEDFSDLEEKYKWCMDHDAECKKISENATEFASQFLDTEKETEITQEVIRRFFE